MSPNFYKDFWGIIRKDVTSLVQSFFKDSELSRAVNHTLLTFVPKWIAVNRVDQYRLITLCNVIYKTIKKKIIATRLKLFLDSLIHPLLSAFILYRAILDNVITNHEIVNYFKSRKLRRRYMAVKVDKGLQMVLIIYSTISYGNVSSTHFSVLVNSSPHDFFPSSCGIRQGDPLCSHFLRTFSQGFY